MLLGRISVRRRVLFCVVAGAATAIALSGGVLLVTDRGSEPNVRSAREDPRGAGMVGYRTLQAAPLLVGERATEVVELWQPQDGPIVIEKVWPRSVPGARMRRWVLWNWGSRPSIANNPSPSLQEQYDVVDDDFRLHLVPHSDTEVLRPPVTLRPGKHGSLELAVWVEYRFRRKVGLVRLPAVRFLYRRPDGRRYIGESKSRIIACLYRPPTSVGDACAAFRKTRGLQ